jgi:glycosyltransferase involved in cell wall biosynthesis
MKIAFLTPEYPHPLTGHSGGIGTSIKNLAQALAEKGFQPTILVYGKSEDVFFEENGIHFYGIKNVKFKGFSWYLTRKKIEKLINNLCIQKKIDIVEAPDWTGITSFINLRCPVVIRENGSDTYFCHLDGRKVKPINFFHEKKALKRADAIISVSQFTGQLTNNLFGLHRDFTVIPNSINTAYFHSDHKHPDNQQILYFGSLIRKKGLLELALIFNEVVETNPYAELILIGKDVRDIMTGNNSTWEMMRALFTAKALKNVVYYGPKPYEEMNMFIETAAVCVFPSFAEALPVSWLEAMAMGKAIVASDIGWAKEMIDDGNSGFLVHPLNRTVFAKKINAILADRALKESLGENARIKVGHDFDAQKIVERNLLFYKNLLS